MVRTKVGQLKARGDWQTVRVLQQNRDDTNVVYEFNYIQASVVNEVVADCLADCPNSQDIFCFKIAVNKDKATVQLSS